MASLVWMSLAALACGQDSPPVRDVHSWARFPLGAWKQVRVISESFGENGELISTSVTETISTLVAVDEMGYTLQLEVTTEVAGKRFPPQVRTIRLGYWGESAGETARLEKLEPQTLVIADQAWPCQLYRIVSEGQTMRRTGRVCFSAEVPPHVLRKDEETRDAAGELLGEQHVETLALNMPVNVLGEIRSASHVRTVETIRGQRTVTLEVMCADVPGGVVAHSSKQLTSSGRIARRSTLELIDYGLSEDSPERDADGPRNHRLRHRLRRSDEIR